MIEARSRAKWKNREGLSEYAVRWNWAEDSSDSGFTAVLRVKDEARSLPFSLPGVLRCVERAIVVDPGSTDGTPAVALGEGGRPIDRGELRWIALATAPASDWPASPPSAG